MTVRDVAVSLTGFAVEWGWAVGESVMLPHLLARPLSLSPSVAGLIYTVNPVFSFLLTPCVGRSADASRALAPEARRARAFRNRRRLVVALAGVAVAGVGLLVAAPVVTRRHRAVEALCCFFFFGVVDLCHDLVLVPGRSLLVATSRGARGADAADALYSLSQLCGRGAALVVIAVLPSRGLRWPRRGGGGGRNVSYFEAAWLSSAAVLAFATAVAALSARPRRTKAARDAAADDDDDDDEEEDDEEEDRGAGGAPRAPRPGTALVLVLVVQFVGWVGLTTFAFWSTTWLGLESTVFGSASLPLVALACQTFVGVGLGPLLPAANRHLGVAPVWICAELLLLASLVRRARARRQMLSPGITPPPHARRSRPRGSVRGGRRRPSPSSRSRARPSRRTRRTRRSSAAASSAATSSGARRRSSTTR